MEENVFIQGKWTGGIHSKSGGGMNVSQFQQVVSWLATFLNLAGLIHYCFESLMLSVNSSADLACQDFRP